MRADRIWKGAALGAILAAAPFAVQAQETRVLVEEEKEPVVNVEVGGGVTDYFNSELKDNTKVGGSWEARATLMPDEPISLELDYLGGLSRVGHGDLEGMDAFLSRNSGQAMVRLNLAEIAGAKQPKDFQVNPYLSAGAEYTNFTLTGDDRNDPAVETVFRDSADLFAIPAAAGVKATINQNVTVGARFSYSYVFDNDLTRLDTNDNAQAWAATADLGLTF